MGVILPYRGGAGQGDTAYHANNNPAAAARCSHDEQSAPDSTINKPSFSSGGRMPHSA